LTVVVASGLIAIALGSPEIVRWLGAVLGSDQAGSVSSGVLVGSAAFLPALVSNRWSRVVASLPPADWDEHWAIWDLRMALRDAKGDAFREVATRARTWLTQTLAPAPEWRAVREALGRQIDVTERIIAGEAVARDEARAVRDESDAIWWKAIHARRRFLR
jgi:hypothetical protein